MKTKGNTQQSKPKSNKATPVKKLPKKTPDVRVIANNHWKAQHRSFSGLKAFVSKTEAQGGGKQHFADLVAVQKEKTGITVTPAMIFQRTGEVSKALDTKKRIFWNKDGSQKPLLSYWEVVANGVGRIARFYKQVKELAKEAKITEAEAEKRLLSVALQKQAEYAAAKAAEEKVKTAA